MTLYRKDGDTPEWLQAKFGFFSEGSLIIGRFRNLANGILEMLYTSGQANNLTMQRLLLVLFVLAALPMAAQIDLSPERFDFEPELSYNPDIQSPADFLGYELGERFTIYAHAVDYFKYLAETSDRIQINQYGTTYEGRPLYNLVVSSTENMSRIEDIRSAHLQLLNANLSANEGILGDPPVFTSLSYNIHGNEASCTEAAMQVAYRLAAANDTETAEVLDASVVIMFMCINPDGRDRYVYWYNGMARSLPAVNPDELAHYAPWPNGRTNHYWFDLNRDWIWGIHPESRGHTTEYQKWMPQVHVDYHEQGYNANYFTAPGTTPRNLLLPDTYEAWSDTFGRANIAQFDRFGLNYFTRDAFDFFYPSYGSSYPSVMGAIGMLTEQGGIAAGRAVETNDGYVLLLRQRVFDHYTTSIATIKKSAERRAELLRYSVDAWNTDSDKSDVAAYYFPQDGGQYVTDVIRMLLLNGIEVEQTTASTTLNGVLDFRTGDRASADFPEGSYVVRTDQARHLFIQSVLGRNLAIEDSVMYDMSTWSAPLAYNIEAYSSTFSPSMMTEPVTTADWQGSMLGMDRNRSAYAYVIPWDQRWAPKALAMLWKKAYRVRSAAAPFTYGNQNFPAGSLIVLRGRNLERSEQMVSDLAEIAEAAQVEIYAMATGRMDEGYDLASTRNVPIKQPKVAMLVEPPFDTYTSGQVYFLFDQDTQLPVDRIRASNLSQTDLPKFGQRYGYTDLDDYDVLILPDGGSGLSALFGKRGGVQLKSWIQRGGTLIALEDAAYYFSKESKFNELEIISSDRDTSEAAELLAYGDRTDYYGKKRIPGTALRAQIDQTNPLGFGLPEEVYTLKFGNRALKPDARLQSVGTYLPNADELLVAGYASEANLEQLAGNTFAGVLPVGNGQIIYLADNPHYRMFWRGPSRLLQNAVMLLPGF